MKAIDQAQECPSEMNNLIVKLVLETCSVIVKFYEEFRKNLIKQLEDFYKSAEHRTTDVVPSI